MTDLASRIVAAAVEETAAEAWLERRHTSTLQAARPDLTLEHRRLRNARNTRRQLVAEWEEQ